MPLFRLLEDFLGAKIWVSNIIAVTICAILSFLIANLNSIHLIINERTFIPALIFIFIIAILPQYQVLNPVLPASVFMIFAIKKILESYNKKGVAYNFFDAGILIGIGSLFYANLIWFGTLIFIGIFLLRSINIKEIVISIIGLITPYLIMFGLYYLLGYDLNELLSLIYNNLFTKAVSFSFSKLNTVALIFISAIAVFSLGQILMLQNTTIISRKAFSLLIWMFFVAIGVCFFVPSASLEMIWIIGMPLSYFIAHFFIFLKRKILSEIIFNLFFLIILLIQVLHIFGR